MAVRCSKFVVFALLILFQLQCPLIIDAWITSPTTKPTTTLSNSVLVSQSHISDALATMSTTSNKYNDESQTLPLSQTLDKLSGVLGGKGRAQLCWDCFRSGVNPLWYFSGNDDDSLQAETETDCNCSSLLLMGKGWNRSQITEIMSSRKQNAGGLGKEALDLLREQFANVETAVSLSKISTSNDGTTKLLLRIQDDGFEVETVIIPWHEHQKSTLCVSSQIGCAQACTFCMTGRMGKLRSLTADEILAQLYWSNKICRLNDIYPIYNVVFMGMGEPADNADHVVQAAQCMVDPYRFQLAPRKVTISTVAPTPESFIKLGKSNVVLAWSVHSSRNDVRKQLVPTTKYSMEKLRDDGLIQALKRRSKKLRNTMIEIALLDKVNDSIDDALHLVQFCQPLLEQVNGVKLVVNLIPWNDINASAGPAAFYKQPSMDRVSAYRQVLRDNNILCYVRTTRGDDKNAACGMLATETKMKKN